MGKYIERQTTAVDVLDLLDNKVDLRNVRVAFGELRRVSPIDFGAWMYALRKRKTKPSSRSDPTQLVVESSYDQKRKEVFEQIIVGGLTSGHTQITIRNRSSEFRTLLDWVDRNAHSGFLSGVADACQAYAAYTEHLNRRILVEKSAKPEHCSTMQFRFLNFCGMVFSESDCQEISRSAIRIEPGTKISADAPSEHQVRAYIAFVCQYIQQLEKKVLEEKLPWGLSLGSDYWVITENWARGHLSARKLDLLDEVNACASDSEKIDVLLKERERRRKVPFRDRGRKRKHLSPMARARNMWGNRVVRAYAELIILITGAYRSEIAQWAHIDSIEIIRDGSKKELSSIKMRANGKEIRHVFGRHGVKVLRKYLDFRERYLDGKKYKYLFFTVSPEPTGKVVEFDNRPDYLNRHFDDMSNGLPILTPRQARKSKSVILDQLGIEHSTAGDMLNHTADVHDNHYLSAPLDQRVREFSHYWSAAKQAVKLIEVLPEGANGLDQTVTGGCKDKGNPVPLSESPPVMPDCLKQYGCLFCKHYAVHADKDDYHKVYSLKYVYLQVRENYENFALADEVLSQIIARAEAVTEKMIERRPETELVAAEARALVFELGVLTPFWERRITRYEQLGIAL